jgi:hypothetical protein
MVRKKCFLYKSGRGTIKRRGFGKGELVTSSWLLFRHSAVGKGT